MYRPFYVGLKGSSAYIYVWITVSKKLIYVGETRKERSGVIGRAYEHLGEDGTLRKRVFEAGYYLEEIEDFLLLSFPLPTDKKYPNYILSNSDRHAVEYLVKSGCLRQVKNICKRDYKLVSESAAITECIEKPVNIKIANDIVEDCIKIISNEMNTANI